MFQPGTIGLDFSVNQKVDSGNGLPDNRTTQKKTTGGSTMFKNRTYGFELCANFVNMMDNPTMTPNGKKQERVMEIELDGKKLKYKTISEKIRTNTASGCPNSGPFISGYVVS